MSDLRNANYLQGRFYIDSDLFDYIVEIVLTVGVLYVDQVCSIL